ncbi:MAG: hypothetical protein AB2A00_12590 [Myxococcota bacterium]
MRQHPPKRRARGYMLIEAVIGGAVVATVLVSVFHMLADGERQAAMAQRRAIAGHALADGMSKYRGMSYGSIGTGTLETSTIGGTGGLVTRTISAQNVNNPSLCLSCKRIIVNVTYAYGKRGQNRVLSGTTYVYQP